MPSYQHAKIYAMHLQVRVFLLHQHAIHRNKGGDTVVDDNHTAHSYILLPIFFFA